MPVTVRRDEKRCADPDVASVHPIGIGVGAHLSVKDLRRPRPALAYGSDQIAARSIVDDDANALRAGRAIVVM